MGVRMLFYGAVRRLLPQPLAGGFGARAVVESTEVYKGQSFGESLKNARIQISTPKEVKKLPKGTEGMWGLYRLYGNPNAGLFPTEEAAHTKRDVITPYIPIDNRHGNYAVCCKVYHYKISP